MTLRRLAGRALLLAACAALASGCVPEFDHDLSADDARQAMARKGIPIPESFAFVAMRQFDCPIGSGGCGFEGNFVAPAERFPDHRQLFADPGRFGQPTATTCAGLPNLRGTKVWTFDCGGILEVVVGQPVDRSSLPPFRVAATRDAEFARIYVYLAPH